MDSSDHQNQKISSFQSARTQQSESVAVGTAPANQNQEMGNEFVKTEEVEVSDSSRRTSTTWDDREGEDVGDESGTAVNSQTSSGASSIHRLSMRHDDQKILEQISETEQRIEEPYHVFSLPKKKYLVYIVSLAGLFSPLSSNIYFPSIGEIAKELKVSSSAVNLTITVYMIVQAIAPSLWGPFSDSLGRRPIFVGTMLVYLISNIGLATSNNYVSLMVFRGIQAAGSAATIAIGAGVISDVATASERGGMVGTFGGIRMMGQALGPVVGGLLTQLFGFRGIFWFLLILGSVALFLIIALLPETLRSIAGNGTTRLVGFQRPLIYFIKPQSNIQKEPDPDAPRRKVTLASIFSPLRFLAEKDVFITLFFGSIVYTVWSMVTSSTTELLQKNFHINEFQVGLAFLPNGLGCVAGSIITGKLLNFDFRKTEREYRKEKNIPDGVQLDPKGVDDFPIEKARLRNIWWIVLIFVGTTVAYGYSFRFNHIAAPLVFQFFIAYTATAVFSLNSTLVVDLYPGKGASATAVNNLMRCSVGALGVAFVEPILEAIGTETTWLILGLITLGMTPLLAVQWIFGQQWRTERAVRQKKREDEKMEVSAEQGQVVYLEQKVADLERKLREMAELREQRDLRVRSL